MRREEYDDWTEDDVEVLYRDASLIVLTKPGGMLTHRGWGDDPVVLVDLVRMITGSSAFPVHRLDRQTSGVMVVALDAETASELGKQFMAREVHKRYLALVRGRVPSRGVINHGLPRRKKGERRRAVTRYIRHVQLDGCAVVEALPETGRMHQIRRHFKHIRHPLLGDSNYGTPRLNREYRQRFNLRRLALHAMALSFRHPHTAEEMQFVAPLPADLVDVFERLGAWEAIAPLFQR